MTSTKRWHEIYAGNNPLTLPQSIARQLRNVRSAHVPTNGDALKYLWLYVSEEGLEGGGIASDVKGFDATEWLNVIDEAASLGAENIIFTVGEKLSKHPELFEVIAWAQGMHGMSVGIHLCQGGLEPADVERIRALDHTRTALFVEQSFVDEVTPLEQDGFRVFSAAGQDQEMVHPTCCLPEVMACMGASGKMYTCGLVLGDTAYYMGEYGEQPLKTVMNDGKVPHIVPEGLPKTHRGCNGCPPLMYRRLNGEDV